MSAKTGIEWTDSTWSPIRVRVKKDAAEIARAKGYTSLVQIAERMAGRVGQHCEHVSPGCEHCYAETNNHRCLPGNGTGLPYDRRARELVEAFVDEKILLQPLKWVPVCTTSGRRCAGRWEYIRPRRIFVQNQSDLFAEWVTDEMLDRVFAVMALCPRHTFQVLTKRPERMLEYAKRVAADDCGVVNAISELRPVGIISWRCLDGVTVDVSYDYEDGGVDCVNPIWPLPNLWLGVSDEGNQHQRIDMLRRIPAAKRFLSMEPLLFDPGTVDLNGIDWVICGGESGPHARPMHPDWARSLRDQCAAAGVPFFFKQHGAWAPISSPLEDPHGLSGGLRKDDVVRGDRQCLLPDGTHFDRVFFEPVPAGAQWMERLGKKAAGALLDGVEHKGFPERGPHGSMLAMSDDEEPSTAVQP